MPELETMPPEVEDLANEVGDFICYWGFKKIHGRLWTHIYLSTEPLDAGQLMQRLRVSKALISLSLNDLLRYDVIVEAAKSSRGTQTYVPNPDTLEVILNVLRRRERKMLAKAETSHRMLSSIGPERMATGCIDTERVDELGRMIHQAQNALASLLELATVDLKNWEEINGKKRSETSTV